MRIEDLKVGDVIIRKDDDPEFSVTVIFMSKGGVVLQYDDKSLSLEDGYGLEDYKFVPKIKKLYAYETSIGGRVDFYTEGNGGSDETRAPQFDIEYKE